jgi:hypothetical protein
VDGKFIDCTIEASEKKSRETVLKGNHLFSGIKRTIDKCEVYQ